MAKAPDNVANPALYAKAKAKATRKFDVYPSAYANAYMVKEYKNMGGKYKGKKMSSGGSVEIQARGCGAIMPAKQKKTRVPRG